MATSSWDDHQLNSIWAKRQRRPAAARLNTAVRRFMDHFVIPRQKTLPAVSEAWQELLPPDLLAHTCLDRLAAGTLYVNVDSAAHMAELDIMVREGLVEHLRQHGAAAVRRIKLVRKNSRQY